METTIPFSGFYESHHSEAIDYSFEIGITDDKGDLFSQELYYLAFRSVDWGKVHRIYAEDYCKWFSEHYGIKVSFVDLSSPREYNFSTDRIFAEIDLKEAERLFSEIDQTKLDELIKERFTSRSGFHSFYPNTLSKWGADISKWDHNQIGTLIEAHVIQHGDENELDYYALSQSADLALDAGIIDHRAWRIASYLRDRANRQYKRTEHHPF